MTVPLPIAVLLVAAGGAIGATLRLLVALGVRAVLDPRTFPLGTLLINVVGSFAIGWIAQTSAGDRAKLFWMTGVLGGFTTFSAFALETTTLMSDDRRPAATAYVLLSVTASIGAALLGARLAR